MIVQKDGLQALSLSSSISFVLELNDVISATKRGGSFYFKAIYDDLTMGDERDAI